MMLRETREASVVVVLLLTSLLFIKEGHAEALNMSSYNISVVPTTPTPTRANGLAPLPPSVCTNITRRNVTGLLAPTSWLDAWLTGPPAVDLRFPWGTSGTWNVASSKTIDDLLKESARGGNFSILIPVFVSTNYANRTVVLYVYDITHQIGLGLVDYFLNRTADYAPTASTVIVTMTAAIFTSSKNISTRRFDLGCTSYGPVPSNISGARWLALAASAAYNVSDVDPWTGVGLAEPNVTVANTVTAPPSVATVENLYLFIALACLLFISLLVGGVYVLKIVLPKDTAQKDIDMASKKMPTTLSNSSNDSQSGEPAMRSQLAAVSFGFDQFPNGSDSRSRPSSTADSNAALTGPAAAAAPPRHIDAASI